MKTALVFGATGLVGSYLVKELSERHEYSQISVFVRTALGFNIPKVTSHVIDFDNIRASIGLFNGDDAFICLGTTLKKAGSVARVEAIDRDLPVEIAGLCLQNGVKNLSVVSSIGANSSSRNYYLRIKGEMEDKILSMGFSNTSVVRPSVLLGKRNDPRIAEAAGRVFMQAFGFLFLGRLKKFRAIHARTVARAMVEISNKNLRDKIYESDQLQLLGN
ncbi:MAG: NAD(P)H-binding protein [Bacteroidales bacterium]|nr:NAD(P)H-binding protein [Bacteroidales bacterium]